MIIVDSSALIPLAWVGRLDLISATFDEIRTTPLVREVVLVDGERGTASPHAFFEQVATCETPPRAEEVASLEGDNKSRRLRGSISRQPGSGAARQRQRAHRGRLKSQRRVLVGDNTVAQMYQRRR